MYNHRLILAGLKEDLIAIVKAMGIDPSSYEKRSEFEEKFGQNYLRLAVWFDVRGIVPDQYIGAIEKHKNKIKFDVASKYVNFNGRRFTDALELTEYIHANFPLQELKYEAEVSSDIDDVPVLVGDGIKIYEINSAGDGRRLVGKDTNWCIGYAGSNNMWQSYRSNKESTFFVVFDENPPTPDQRKVAIDFTKNGIELTDIPNRTGKQLSNGMNADEYFEYLESKGIDLEATRKNRRTGKEETILQNKPVTIEEKIEDKILKQPLKLDNLKLWLSGYVTYGCALEQFTTEKEIEFILKNYEDVKLEECEKNRNSNRVTFKYPDSHYLLSKYIGLGKTLDDEVFDFVFNSPGGIELISKYVNTGLGIPKTQFSKIKNNKDLLSSYIRKQIQAGFINNLQFDMNIFSVLDPENPEDVEVVEKLLADNPNKNLPFGPEHDVNPAWFYYPPFFSSIQPEKVFLVKHKYNDIQKKLHIAYGMVDLYKEDPSVENTMIYLLTGSEYEKLKQEATDLGYERFFRYLKDKTPTRRIENVDKRILELPEFKPLKNKLSAFEYSKLDDTDKSDLDILRYKIFFPFLPGTGVIRDEYSKLISNNKEFWMDVINNRSTYQNEISKIMVEKGFQLYEIQIHSSIIQYMSPELLTDDGILSAIFSKGSDLVINIIIAAGNFNSSLSKKFNPLININFGKWIKAMILSADPGFFKDNVVKEFIKYYDALQSTFGDEILPFVEDIKIELIKKSYHNYFVISENRSKLISEDNILLFLDLYGNNDQVIKIILENKFEDLRIFNLYSPAKIKIQKALYEIPVLRDYLVENYPNVLRDVTGYKSESKPLSRETSEMIDKLSNLASRFDKENKYRLADKITEYMLKF